MAELLSFFFIEGNALLEFKSEIVQSWNNHPKGDYGSIILPRGDYRFIIIPRGDYGFLILPGGNSEPSEG